MPRSGTLVRVKGSISVVLFFLLSGFFLSALLGALERSRKLLGIAVACCIAVACVIVFLTPVQLPSLLHPNGTTTTTVTTNGGP
jgi:hypothetical protein